MQDRDGWRKLIMESSEVGYDLTDMRHVNQVITTGYTEI